MGRPIHVRASRTGDSRERLSRNSRKGRAGKAPDEIAQLTREVAELRSALSDYITETQALITEIQQVLFWQFQEEHARGRRAS